MSIGGLAISGMTRYGSRAALRAFRRQLPESARSVENQLLGIDLLADQAARLARLNRGGPLYRQLRREALHYSTEADNWVHPVVRLWGKRAFLLRQVDYLRELNSTLRKTGLLGPADLERLQQKIRFIETTLYHASSPRLINPGDHRASQLFSMALSELESLKRIAQEQAETLALKGKLLRVANRTAENAHAPRSEFHVGAAVSTEKGIFGGCNVESDSYGLTQCAERASITHAISHGARKIRAIALVTPDNKPGVAANLRMPCGGCRQVMAEHLPEDAWVFIDGVGDFRMRQLILLPFKLS